MQNVFGVIFCVILTIIGQFPAFGMASLLTSGIGFMIMHELSNIDLSSEFETFLLVVIPSILIGSLSGAAAMGITRLAFKRADFQFVVLWASLIFIGILAASRIVFPQSNHLIYAAEIPGAILGFLIAGFSLSRTMDFVVLGIIAAMLPTAVFFDLGNDTPLTMTPSNLAAQPVLDVQPLSQTVPNEFHSVGPNGQ